MKIIHVVASLDPAQGGPARSTPSLAAAQAKLGHDVTLFYNAAPDRMEDIKVSTASIPHFDLVNIVTCPQPGGLEKYTGNRAGRIFKTILDKNTVIHIHGLWLPIFQKAASLSIKQGAKYIIAPRGMLNPWSLNQRSWKKKLALHLIWRRLLNHAFFLHVLNADEKKFITSLNLSCTMKIIPNGIFTEDLNNLPPKNRFYNFFPSINYRPYILFLSRLHKVKGLDYLAEAFNEFAKNNNAMDLVVAGPDEGEKDKFMNHIEHYGITERVHIVGPLYGEKKYAAFVDAKCFCQPSRQEGFSMAAAEAMGCGLPVVISKNCHFPEVAEAGAGIMVDLDAKAISRALHMVLDNEGKRVKMGEAAQKLILSRFTWPNIAERTIAAYKR
jgi:glycosyltransferase involved in cell wall biosynthesis